MAKTITVSSAAALVSAFNSATSATTILLTAGDYGDVILKNGKNVGLVTIKSANISAEASFHTLKLNGVNNVQFESIEVSHALKPGEVLWTPAISVLGSSNVSFGGMYVHGSLNGTSFDDGQGITVIASKNISIADSTFTELNVALSINNTSGIVVAGNTATLARSFMVGVAMKNGLFELNYLHDMMPNYALNDHPDFFQVATGNVSAPSNNLTFRSNVMIESPGDYIGGIYVQSERFDEGVRHTNIKVENNYFLGNYRHALSFTGVENLTVSHNTILNTDGTNPTAAIALKDVHNALVSQNITPLITQSTLFPNTGVTLTKNIDVWDPQFKIGVKEDTIVHVPDAKHLDISKLGVIAGSVAAQWGAGFAPVAHIGDLAGTEASILTHYRSVLSVLARGGVLAGTLMAGDGNIDLGLHAAIVGDDSSVNALAAFAPAGTETGDYLAGHGFAGLGLAGMVAETAMPLIA